MTNAPAAHETPRRRHLPHAGTNISEDRDATAVSDANNPPEQRVQQHQLAMHRLHVLGHTMKIGDKLNYLQKGHCLHTLSTRIASVKLTKSRSRMSASSARAPTEAFNVDKGEATTSEQYCQDKFNVSLQIDTAAVDPPSGVSVPKCSCDQQ